MPGIKTSIHTALRGHNFETRDLDTGKLTVTPAGLESQIRQCTFSIVVHACRKGVVKQSGRGPPSRQILDSISIRTESSKPRGFVA